MEMNEKEALKEIQRNIENLIYTYKVTENDDSGCDNLDILKRIDANRVAKISLKKQIPQKPQYTEDKQFAICKCNGEGLRDGWKFCPECGQAIDWS